MKIEEFKEQISAIGMLNLCDLQIQISKNAIIHYVEGEVDDWDESNPESFKMKEYTVSVSFYGQQYFIWIKEKDLQKNYGSFCMEGHSDLFDSCESAFENDYWEYLQQLCLKCGELIKKYELSLLEE
ncbi:hypothetical protein [Mangrovibacterium sp.]|uniref:hypothetical protein n=1 Tax=Mangrovibacterium sp. TaxID=1961364 RepID=UPI0035649BA8